MSTYRVPFVILLWIHPCTHCAIGTHRLILIFSKVKHMLSLVVVNALDDLGPDKRTSGDDALQRHHAIEVTWAERTRVACKLSEAALVGAVVHLSTSSTFHPTEAPNNMRPTYRIVRGLLGWSVWERSNYVLQRLIEGLHEVERSLQQPVGSSE